jgi:uncharacterized repeat protein (TIGR03803 family)
MTKNRISDCSAVAMLYFRAPHALVFIVMLALSLVASQPAQAQTFTVLVSFSGLDGEFPNGGLLLDRAGNLYGVTNGKDNGTVYKVSKSGKLTTLHSFDGTDGEDPQNAPVMDVEGNLYGTTKIGGSYNQGLLYKLSKTGKETVLYTFTGGADGGYPIAGVTMDAEGNLFGTTDTGGTSSQHGVVYKLNKTGKEIVLHRFTGDDGENPFSGVILDAEGNLYGTTYGGGLPACQEGGCGVVFKMDKSGKETVLHRFAAGKDGDQPIGTPVMDKTGNLYGTTTGGGPLNTGTVYKVSKTGKETVLYTFMGGSDGYYPDAGVVMDAEGNLYGTTDYGGSNDLGVVYKVSKAGEETVLYTFTGGADGGIPGGVVMDAEGNLYGTAFAGGNLSCGEYGCGTVWKLKP